MIGGFSWFPNGLQQFSIREPTESRKGSVLNQMPTGIYKRSKNVPGAFKKGSVPWNKDTKGLMPVPWNFGLTYEMRHDKQFKAGHTPWNKDKEHMKDNNHPMWKGGDVKYRGLHMWIENKLGKPTKCESCEEDGLTGHQIHWANKSGKYLRELTDWVRLCAKCHKAYDRGELVLQFS